MKATVQVSRGIESLFGTRDENMRLLETGLNIRTTLGADTLEIEGEPESVSRAEGILEDYFALVREGVVFKNGDLNSLLRVVTADPEVTLRSLFKSGQQRSFGKKVLAPKTVTQAAPKIKIMRFPGRREPVRNGVSTNRQEAAAITIDKIARTKWTCFAGTSIVWNTAILLKTRTGQCHK